MADGRLVRRQLRTNGELLLRTTPPSDGSALRPVENSSWSDHWTAFYEQHPDLRPRLERSETFPRERLCDELSAVLVPGREYVLVVSVHGHPEAVGVEAATVAGSGAAVTGYVVDLIEGGRDDLFVLDEPGGTALSVDQDEDANPGMVLLRQYRWPEVAD
jgi:hypothetical protein